MSRHQVALAQSLHGRLQDGIYIGGRPGQAYRLLLLNVRDGATPDRTHAALATVWGLLGELQRGEVRDLQRTRPGETAVAVPPGGLTCLLGFGARLFEHGATLFPNMVRPGGLTRLGQGLGHPFPRLRWDERATREGEADLALQLIADTELAVDRAIMEVYRVIREDALPLEFVSFYGGFQREDGRSWLNFHDGLSNIRREQRAAAIEVQGESLPRDPSWMVGGTYMVFLRLALRLEQWWPLSRDRQEILVGRDKLSGCPLVRVTGGVAAADPGCPLHAGHPFTDSHRDPGRPASQLVALSHMHRANPTRQAPSDQSNRIFRQGYEFLESLPGERPRAGLNFVSFQCDLARFTRILTTPGWLATVNFGGPDDRRDIPLVSLATVIAGGYYAVPPTDDPFPGAAIFRRPAVVGRSLVGAAGRGRGGPGA